MRFAMVLAFQFGCLSISGQSLGQPSNSRTTIRLPKQTELSQGFFVTISYPKMLNTGYMPLSISIQADTAFVRDRNLRLVIDSIDPLIIPNSNGLRYETPLQIEEGQITHQDELMLPKWFAGQSYRMKLLEDDQAIPGYEVLEEYSIPSSTLLKTVFQPEFRCDWLYISPSFLEEDAGIPFLRSFVNPSPAASEYTKSNPQTYLNRYREHFENQWRMLSKPESLNTFWLNAGIGSRTGRGNHLVAQELENLSNDWRFYQNQDAILIHQKTLETLRQTKPKRYAAIHRWQLLGGTIVVFGSPPSPTASQATRTERADPVATSVEKQLSALRENQMNLLTSLMQSMLGEFQPEHSVTKIFPLKDREGIERFHYVLEKEDESGETFAIPIGSDFSKNLMDQFRIASEIYHRIRTDGAFPLANHEYDSESFDPMYNIKMPDQIDTRHWGFDSENVGLGQTIYLFPSHQTLAEMGLLWPLIQERIGDDISPTLRRGIDAVTSGQRFDDWKIPGISEPPVYTFIGFLTSFFVCVGPLTYWRAKRIGRTYLVFAIAPILAIVTTIAMFSYGIIADGFASVARIRQITWVDGTSKQGVERIRSTYFAGVEIQDSLQFPFQAEVFPFIDHGGATWKKIAEHAPSKLGTVILDQQTQEFAPSFLPPRVQRQFISHHPRPQIGCLSIRHSSSKAPDPILNTPVNLEYSNREKPLVPIVTNHFDFHLKSLIFRDKEGWHWHVPTLPPGKESLAVLLTSADASKKLGQLYITNRPIGAAKNSTNPNRRSYRDTSGLVDFPLYISQEINSKEKQLNGKMETWLQNRLLLLGELPVSHFVATTDVSDDAIAIENCEIQSSVHYVIGTLP